MTEHGTDPAWSGIFAGLSPDELVLVSAAARPVRFGAGQRLFSEGAPARGCWLIHDGCVALDVMIPGRGQVVVQTLGHGDVLGWSWLLPPYQWHFGAVAVRPTTATELDTDRLRALAGQNPQFGYALTLSLFQACAQRLQATRARLLDLYRSPLDQP
ncbi:MAG: Crp/Fnr family transcriptional regulator [Streptosporangiaceae bacterium]